MKNKKPTFDRKRPLSWSAISSFEYSPEQWYRKYVLKQEDPPSAEMLFGKKFAESCEARKPLAPVTLLDEMEHRFETVFDGIPLIGFADTYCSKTHRKIFEFKTGVKKWDKQRVDKHGQIDMYLLMHWLITKIKPEEVEVALEWIPTEKNVNEKYEDEIDFLYPIKVHHFETKRTMADIVRFGKRIKDTYAMMIRYCEEHE